MNITLHTGETITFNNQTEYQKHMLSKYEIGFYLSKQMLTNDNYVFGNNIWNKFLEEHFDIIKSEFNENQYDYIYKGTFTKFKVMSRGFGKMGLKKHIIDKYFMYNCFKKIDDKLYYAGHMISL
jgi:hypothetical protein